ncbi:unnamed protein product [Euphydryas editha]|uniref:SWIM-type domain-containing protein n=1 Tax=Euphydryas editha TaxID=104508 RepID=A0AAU9TT79_EUPED|nr:unnamed protein product [Euphydryas editha]
MKDFKIAAAIINCFQEPYEDSRYTNQFIDIINNVNNHNHLCDYVLEHNLNRQRVAFIRMQADLSELADFPRLTHEDLILIAVGTYHLKIARSYCSEHIKQTGVYELEVFRHPELIHINDENCVLIRCRIQSRHVRSKIYYTYILYKRENGRNGISGYYCSCIHGRRTLGCCAHVMSVLYYLGWARHEEQFAHPASFLDHVVLDIENR